MTGEYSFSDIVKALDIYELLRCKAVPAILKVIIEVKGYLIIDIQAGGNQNGVTMQ